MPAALMSLALPDESATERLGRRIATCLQTPLLVFLRGELGAGKTTLCRGLLRGLGYQGLVKSPTYTLCETYEAAGVACLHCDFYRLSNPHEMEYLGLREQFAGECVLLIEWPEIAAEMLPAPDIDIALGFESAGRVAELRGGTVRGAAVLESIRRQEAGTTGSNVN